MPNGRPNVLLYNDIDIKPYNVKSHKHKLLNAQAVIKDTSFKLKVLKYPQDTNEWRTNSKHFPTNTTSKTARARKDRSQGVRRTLTYK